MSDTTNEQPAEQAEPTTDADQGNPGEESLGDPGKKALDRMKAERNEAKQQAAELKRRLDEIEQANLSELEKAQRRAEAAEKQLAETAANALKQRIALEKGLPASLVARLQGSTEEELAADADALLELVRTPTTPKPDPSQGAKGDAPKGSGDRFADFAEGFFTR